MEIKNVLAGVAVSNLAVATDWYSKLFDRGPDQRPMDNLAEYRFSGGGWLQVFEDEARAGNSSITLAVDDLDEWIVHAGTHGMEARDTQRGDYVSTSILDDPDGNQVVLAQAGNASNASVA